jgi:HK97 family phage prohead protease
MISFVLNDELERNSYGFRVLNSELSLKRFDKNPVLLLEHDWSVSSLLGRVANIRIEGSRLLGDFEFDGGSVTAMEVKRKIEAGYLKSCSIGFMPRLVSTDADGTDNYGGELVEVSVCAVPSNMSAVALYADNLEVVADNSVAVFLGLDEKHYSQKKLEMTPEEKQVLDDLKKANETLLEELNALKKEQSDNALTAAKSLVDGAVKSGKLTADKAAAFEKLAVLDYALAAEMLSAIPVVKSLELESDGAESGVKDFAAYLDLSDVEKLSFEKAHPVEYKRIWNLEFPHSKI